MKKDPPQLYLDLMKRSVTNWIYGGDQRVYSVRNPVKRFLVNALNRRGYYLMRSQPLDYQKKTEGKEWPPPLAHTMVGLKRLDNLQQCIEKVLHDDIPGDFIETGVWRGGASIFMRAVLKAYNVRDRCVWAADSFEGLPAPDPDCPADQQMGGFHEWKFFEASLENVRENFNRYGLLDDQVRFLKGWFRDTLPQIPAEQRFAVARLDGDMYESTMDALTHLYPKLSPGGFLIIDDYWLEACRKAVEDYRQANKIEEEMLPIDWTGVYWQKKFDTHTAQPANYGQKAVTRSMSQKAAIEPIP